MARVAVLYRSFHHHNTIDLLERLSRRSDMDLFETRGPLPDLSGYQIVGLASGIYFGRFHQALYQAAEKLAPSQKVFLLSTCGLRCRRWSRSIVKVLEARGVELVGQFCCRGWDTYGFLKLIGGLARHHPNDRDLASADEFIEAIFAQLAEPPQEAAPATL